MEYGLGRLAAPDARDMHYLLAAPRLTPTRTSRSWYANGWWGNQQDRPFCVGYAWAHFVEDSPRTHPAPGPFVDPVAIYDAAQRLDEFPGENYDGTSVRAGAKALKSMGVIREFLWAFDVDTIARNVLEVGPVVMGTDWHESMFTSDAKGRIRPDGPIAGGHAYVINGYSIKTRLFRLKNSWSRSWSINGFAWIHADDLATLLASDGEAAMATEI